jgi:alkylated DNA nucleotide flippase Atl1
MAREIARRVSALEHAANPDVFKPWHRIMVDDGQTEEEAIAAYQAEHGPLGNDDCFVIRFFTGPVPDGSSPAL